MTSQNESDPLAMEFFEAKYRRDPDPWRFSTSPYELNRYDEIIKALGNRRFHRAFEPGCSIGILTERLASCCDRVVATDISSTAVRQARRRCRAHRGVTIAQGALSADAPAGKFDGGEFDLVVLSEIGYYFDTDSLSRLSRRLFSSLSRGGTLLAEHWLGLSADHLLQGDQVHQTLGDTLGLSPVFSRRYEGFRIDSWTRS